MHISWLSKIEHLLLPEGNWGPEWGDAWSKLTPQWGTRAKRRTWLPGHSHMCLSPWGPGPGTWGPQLLPWLDALQVGRRGQSGVRGTDGAQRLYVLPSLPPLTATADSAVCNRNPEAETSKRRERDSFLQEVPHSPSLYRSQVSRRKILPFRRWRCLLE